MVTYLISAHSMGKTIAHSVECKRQLSPPCACPVRLAFKTVDSMIDRLRSAFNVLGREGRENPKVARVVKTYLKDVTNEQLIVGLVPEQTECSSILRKAESGLAGNFGDAEKCKGYPSLLPPSNEGDVLSGDGLSPTREEVGGDEDDIKNALPRRPNLLFNYVFGKTLRRNEARFRCAAVG